MCRIELSTLWWSCSFHQNLSNRKWSTGARPNLFGPSWNFLCFRKPKRKTYPHEYLSITRVYTAFLYRVSHRGQLRILSRVLILIGRCLRFAVAACPGTWLTSWRRPSAMAVHSYVMMLILVEPLGADRCHDHGGEQVVGVVWLMTRQLALSAASFVRMHAQAYQQHQLRVARSVTPVCRRVPVVGSLLLISRINNLNLQIIINLTN